MSSRRVDGRVCADAYTDGPGILMELIQNADDSHATDISFMLSMTEYATDSLFGEELSRRPNCLHTGVTALPACPGFHVTCSCSFP